MVDPLYDALFAGQEGWRTPFLILPRGRTLGHALEDRPRNAMGKARKALLREMPAGRA